MTLTEFKNQVYHTRTSVVIPSLGAMRIDKSQFIVKGKYNPKLLFEYLEKIYNQNYKK